MAKYSDITLQNIKNTQKIKLEAYDFENLKMKLKTELDKP